MCFYFKARAPWSRREPLDCFQALVESNTQIWTQGHRKRRKEETNKQKKDREEMRLNKDGEFMWDEEGVSTEWKDAANHIESKWSKNKNGSERQKDGAGDRWEWACCRERAARLERGNLKKTRGENSYSLLWMVTEKSSVTNSLLQLSDVFSSGQLFRKKLEEHKLTSSVLVLPFWARQVLHLRDTHSHTPSNVQLMEGGVKLFIKFLGNETRWREIIPSTLEQGSVASWIPWCEYAVWHWWN